MAKTLDPARPSPGAGKYPLDPGRFDEAFATDGTPRPPYAAVLDALARHDLSALRERVQALPRALGLDFGKGRPLTVDPVPRLIEAGEWAALEAGLTQRARALNAFLLDAYGGQRIFDAGVVPRRLLESSTGYEPRMQGLLDPAVPPATVAGLDLSGMPMARCWFWRTICGCPPEPATRSRFAKRSSRRSAGSPRDRAR